MKDKLKAAAAIINELLASCGEGEEEGESEDEKGKTKNPFGDKDYNDGGQDFDPMLPNPLGKKGAGADKVKMISSVMKKKMGL